jgi:hypothetical protein
MREVKMARMGRYNIRRRICTAHTTSIATSPPFNQLDGDSAAAR